MGVMVDVGIPRRTVIERARQARWDLRQLDALAADKRLIETAPDAVTRIVHQKALALDEALTSVLDAPPETSPADLWASMSELQKDVEGLHSEWLIMATGSILRSLGADQGLCAVADRLLSESTTDLPIHWDAFTVPGQEDRTSYLTGMIALQTPAGGFWSLPVALHEMGHVVAQTLDTSRNGQAKNPVRAVIVDGDNKRQREELFADFFATYTSGPAYAGAMVLARFDPKEALADAPFEDGKATTATHPSVDKRVYVIAETLRRMDDTAGKLQHPYRHAITLLSSAWGSQCAEVGVSTEVDSKSAKRLRALVDRFWEVGASALKPARHRTRSGDGLEMALLGKHQPPPVGEVTVRDVIDAAWELRLKGQDTSEVADNALAFVGQVMGRVHEQ